MGSLRSQLALWLIIVWIWELIVVFLVLPVFHACVLTFRWFIISALSDSAIASSSACSSPHCTWFPLLRRELLPFRPRFGPSNFCEVLRFASIFITFVRPLEYTLYLIFFKALLWIWNVLNSTDSILIRIYKQILLLIHLIIHIHQIITADLSIHEISILSSTCYILNAGKVSCINCLFIFDSIKIPELVKFSYVWSYVHN